MSTMTKTPRATKTVEVDIIAIGKRKGRRGSVPAFDVLCEDGQVFTTMKKPSISQDIQRVLHGPATPELNSGRIIGIR